MRSVVVRRARAGEAGAEGRLGAHNDSDQLCGRLLDLLEDIALFLSNATATGQTARQAVTESTT